MPELEGGLERLFQDLAREGKLSAILSVVLTEYRRNRAILDGLLLEKAVFNPEQLSEIQFLQGCMRGASNIVTAMRTLGGLNSAAE